MPTAFDRLPGADLVIDEVYLGGTSGGIGDDPIARLLPVGNQGGFRYKGSPLRRTVSLVVLYTSGFDEDWPDVLNTATGLFTYYGDNKTPGHDLHGTQRRGNLILRDTFANAHGDSVARATVPPFLLFRRAAEGGHAVQFRGLMVPGSDLIPPSEDLVALWRSRGEQRFQNYKSTFTVLDVPCVPRAWINDILAGHPVNAAPPAWKAWVEARAYEALRATPTRTYRTKTEQLPGSASDLALLRQLYNHFADRPVSFEQCAIELFKLLVPDPRHDITLTRASRDGGRDAVGRYAIGPAADPIHVTFALEAKCYQPGQTSVGVRDVARLISRIRHREFGVLVTTSFVNDQAYKEVRDDGHNVIIMCGADIVEVLKTTGRGSRDALQRWLDVEFPIVPPAITAGVAD